MATIEKEKALDVVRQMVADGQVSQEVAEKYFPELKESEDEGIRKSLIDYFKNRKDDGDIDETWYGISYDEILFWLEKQGEQKSVKFKPLFKFGDVIKPKDPALGEPRIIKGIYPKFGYDTNNGILDFEFEDNWELVEKNPAWSEEDETTKNNISHIIRQYDKISKKENQPCWYVGDCLLWMQNIKDRVQPQPKHEWSEEDKRIIDNLISQLGNLYTRKLIKEETKDKYVNWLKSLKDKVQPKQEWSEQEQVRINRIVACLENLNVADNDILLKDVDWLKSLRPQGRWKPSDEQMKALADALSLAKNCGEESAFDLRTLYEQLKKLIKNIGL